MYKYNTPQELFTAICDKIRDKTNSNELINHQDIPDKIDNLVDSGIINEYNELLSMINQNNTIIELNNNEIEDINICFIECTSLTTIDLPKCTSIVDNVFRDCTNLTTVNLPKCTSIGNYAFNNCTSLTTVNLPKCTEIEYYAFNTCTNLTTIIFGADQVAHIDTGVFSNTPIAKGTGYVYVPDNLVDSYKTANSWSRYANQIKPISELSDELKEEYNL